MTTKMLADFTAKLTYNDLSARSREMAKRSVLDWLGVSIRGSQELPARILRQTLLRSDSADSTLFTGEGKKTSVYNAAFCNGAASHCLDFDDLHNPSIIHLACVVIPGVFAIGELHHKSGKDMITAVCAGYEAGARAGEATIPESYFFWHTTGTAGTFGAAAAAGNLLGLTPEETLMCYGSAGTQAAGLWEFLKEGAMSKALHAGKSAFAGVLSAYLAQNGFTGASEILEGEKGFCKALSSAPHFDKLVEGLGSGRLKIDDNSFKPYACCKHSHAALYAIQQLRKEYKLTANNVQEVRLHVNDITDYLINNSAPSNPYGCKFSIQYCAAVMLKDGAAGLEQFTPEAVSDPLTRKIMQKIRVIRDEEIENIRSQDPARLASKVVIVLTDGTQVELRIDYPKGDPENPFTWEEAHNKFLRLSEPVYGEKKAESLYTLIENLEKYPDFAKALEQIMTAS